MSRISCCLLLLILFGSGEIKADTLNITGFGNLFISNYTPAMYEAFNQNWDICEGKNGLIYVANGALLEGGSDSWQKIPVGEGKYCRSVHPCHDDKILVGSNQEIGLYSRAGLPGEVSYVSIMDKLDARYHDFGSVWQISEHDSIYYLRAGKAIFRYDMDTIVPLIYGKIVDYMKFIDNDLYVLIAGEGLGKIMDIGVDLLPFGRFFSDKRVVSMLAIEEDKILIFTDDEGVFIAKGNELEPFQPFNDPRIVDNQISSAVLLDDYYVAIGTVRNGVYILDRSGTIIQQINKQSGLQNNTVIAMVPDSNYNLWLALDYGLSYVYLNSCLSILNSADDIGTGYVSKRFRDKLYLGTNQGLYYMDWVDNNGFTSKTSQILPVNNISGQVWNLQVLNNTLYCSHHKGLYRIEDDQAEFVSAQEGSWGIEELSISPDHYLQSTYRGFFIYTIDERGDIKLLKKLDQVPPSRIFAQDKQGNVWVAPDIGSAYCFTLDQKTFDVAELKTILPDAELGFEKIRIFENGGNIVFNTDKGFYSYNSASGGFEELKYYNDLFSTGELMTEFFEDEYDRIWYVTESQIGYLSTRFGQMEKVTRPFSLVSRFYTGYLGIINVINEGNVLFGEVRGFYHFNTQCSMLPSKAYKPYIIDLKTFAPPINENKQGPDSWYPVYSHYKNTFDFSFSSNIIESQEKIQYKFKLEGYDDEWSAWSDRSTKEFANLREGTYTLRLIARDESGTESQEATFTFQVKPPPHRTIYAYLIYITLITFLIVLGIRYRDRKVEKEKMKVKVEKQKEIEERKKRYEDEQMKSKQQITELVNDRLHQDLKHKSKELSNSMINILHKNEILLNLKQEMQELYLEKNLGKRDMNIKKLINVIDREISTKKDLEVFDTNFNAVHEAFLKNLKEQYPTLNQNDHRLCTFIKMNKSTKEIATFLNLSIRGVETSRYRLRKKMGLDSDENLYDIISRI
jgi:ligand-binding sensor domain-containing protein/DNA-binding CsgD family transcriptional regulator